MQLKSFRSITHPWNFIFFGGDRTRDPCRYFSSDLTIKLQQTVISLDERSLNKNKFKKFKAKRLKKRKLENYLSKVKKISRKVYQA